MRGAHGSKDSPIGLLTDEEIPKRVDVFMWVFQRPPRIRLTIGVVYADEESAPLHCRTSLRASSLVFFVVRKTYVSLLFGGSAKAAREEARVNEGAHDWGEVRGKVLGYLTP